MLNERALSPSKDSQPLDVTDMIKHLAEDGNASELSTFTEQFIAGLTGDDNTDCPICFNEIEIPMVIPRCMHQLYVLPLHSIPCIASPTYSCKDCIVSHVGIREQRGQPACCPTCSRGPIKVCIVFIDLQDLKHIQTITILEQGVVRSDSERDDWFTTLGINCCPAKE